MDTTTHNAHLLHQLSSVLLRQAEQALQEQLGIGLSQYKIMIILRDRPYMQQRQIAKSLDQTEAAVSRQIKLLVKQGLIETTIDPNNRRAHGTSLTTKGARFTETAHSIYAKTQATTLNELDDKQQKASTEILEKLYWHARNADSVQR